MEFYLVETLDKSKPYEVYCNENFIGYVTNDLDGYVELNFFDNVSTEIERACRDKYPNWDSSC